MNFKEWLALVEDRFQDVLNFFGYRPGQLVTPDQFRTDYRTLATKWHPDRNVGVPQAEINVRLANDGKDFLKPYIDRGEPFPSYAAPPPPPRPQPSPPPQPERQARRQSTEPPERPAGFHGMSVKDFGKYLHQSFITYALDLANKGAAARSERVLEDITNKIVNATSRARIDHENWKEQNRGTITSPLTHEDFMILSEPFITPDDEEAAGIEGHSVQGMRNMCKRFHAAIIQFYNRYIEAFPDRY